MKILTERQLAAELGLSPWTIRLWRIKASLPYFRTSGRIFYRLETVKDWMAEKERLSVSHTDAKSTTSVVSSLA